MKILKNTSSQQNISSCSLTNKQMLSWRKFNKLPSYVNASYAGYTGAKEVPFSVFKTVERSVFDVTDKLRLFEESVIQELKDLRGKPFGYIRALWKIGQNMGTGASWDTKFLPQFPGRNVEGRTQYASYKKELVSGNDISNIAFIFEVSGKISDFLIFIGKLLLPLYHSCQYVNLPLSESSICSPGIKSK
jgi:hypothetical protein